MASLSARRFLVFAAAFGLVTGLLEGLGLLAFHGFGLWNSRIPEGVSAPIVGISAAVNCGLFVAVGCLLLLAWKLLPSLPLMRAAGFVFTFLICADLLGVSGRISPLGIVALSAGLATVASRRLVSHRQTFTDLAPRLLPWLATAALLAFTLAYATAHWRESAALKRLPPAAKNTPNLVLVVVDTLRADHTTPYGYSLDTTPNLETIAREGALFDDAISSSSWTLPAHQSLLTGRYPHEHGPLREQVVNQNLPSLPRILAAKGFRTGAFSANSDFFCRRAGFAASFLHFEDYFYSVGDMVYRTFWGRLFFRTYVSDLLGIDELPARKNAAEVNRETLDWIDRDRSRPFFVVLNYLDAHYPYVPEQPYRSRFLPPTRPNCAHSLAHKLNPLHRPTEFEVLMAMTPPCFQVQIAQYDGAIAYIDAQIANLFEQLRQRGLDHNTLVIITSDHGESFREHGLVTHGTSLYRELIHVPLIVWWPGHIPAGMRINRPVSTASVPATVLDLLGDDQRDFPIPSLARLWTDPSTQSAWPDPVSEMAQDLYIPRHYPAYRGWLKSITDSQWHLIVSQKDPAELYAWPHDPQESQNLAQSSAVKTVVNDLNAGLWNQVQSGHAKAPSESSGASPELARAIK
jgi:arylsulfatase A-like enzyme